MIVNIKNALYKLFYIGLILLFWFWYQDKVRQKLILAKIFFSQNFFKIVKNAIIFIYVCFNRTFHYSSVILYFPNRFSDIIFPSAIYACNTKATFFISLD